MKKYILGGITILVIAVAAWNVNLNSRNIDCQKFLANVEALAQEPVRNVNCSAGGPGASSCSISQDYPGGLGSSKSVTCQSGYYACCTKDTWGNLGASCVPL